MIIEKIYAASVIIIGIAFVYQYGRRLMAETKLHELEQDIEAVNSTIQTERRSGHIINHSIKSEKVAFILSEYIRARLLNKLQNKSEL